MKRKPNYGLNRADRQRAKEAKRTEKLEAKRERAAKRKEDEPQDENPSTDQAVSE